MRGKVKQAKSHQAAKHSIFEEAAFVRTTKAIIISTSTHRFLCMNFVGLCRAAF